MSQVERSLTKDQQNILDHKLLHRKQQQIKTINVYNDSHSMMKVTVTTKHESNTIDNVQIKRGVEMQNDLSEERSHGDNKKTSQTSNTKKETTTNISNEEMNDKNTTYSGNVDINYDKQTKSNDTTEEQKQKENSKNVNASLSAQYSKSQDDQKANAESERHQKGGGASVGYGPVSVGANYSQEDETAQSNSSQNKVSTDISGSISGGYQTSEKENETKQTSKTDESGNKFGLSGSGSKIDRNLQQNKNQNDASYNDENGLMVHSELKQDISNKQSNKKYTKVELEATINFKDDEKNEIKYNTFFLTAGSSHTIQETVASSNSLIYLSIEFLNDQGEWITYCSNDGRKEGHYMFEATESGNQLRQLTDKEINQWMELQRGEGIRRRKKQMQKRKNKIDLETWTSCVVIDYMKYLLRINGENVIVSNIGELFADAVDEIDGKDLLNITREQLQSITNDNKTTKKIWKNLQRIKNGEVSLPLMDELKQVYDWNGNYLSMYMSTQDDGKYFKYRKRFQNTNGAYVLLNIFTEMHVKTVYNIKNAREQYDVLEYVKTLRQNRKIPTKRELLDQFEAFEKRFLSQVSEAETFTEYKSEATKKQDKIPYFLQVSSFTEECITVRLDILKPNKKTLTYEICDCSNRNVLEMIKMRKNKLSANKEIDVDIIEDIDSDSFKIAVYDSKGDKPLSNIIKLMKFPDGEEYPPNKYKPEIINVKNIVKVINETENKLYLYWDIPLNTYGDNILYKMIPYTHDTNDKEDMKDEDDDEKHIETLPYSISLDDVPEKFKIKTICLIDDEKYYSDLSFPIDIGTIKMEQWCNKHNLSDMYPKLIENNFDCLSKIALLSYNEKKNLCNKLALASLDKNVFLKNLPRISSKNTKRMIHNVNSIENNETRENVTLLVVGKTGEGKTTTINSMMNYLFDADFEGDRYRLIIEKFDKKKQTQSQTDKISIYHVCPIHPDINYNITIVDTPGFANCDDKGRKFDEEIGKQLQELFETKIDEINGICLVMRAGITRLTEEQSYVFTQIIDKFAKNVADNIILLFTFDDGSKPPKALSAVDDGKICHRKKYFAFNNRGFEFDENKIDSSKQQQFEQSMEVFADFFKEITIPSPQSLSLSVKQLKDKAKLREVINEFSEQLDEGLTVCATITNRIKQIEENKDAIDAGEKAFITLEYKAISIQRIPKKRLAPSIMGYSAEQNKQRNKRNSLVSVDEFQTFYVCDNCQQTVELKLNWFRYFKTPRCHSGHKAEAKPYRYTERMRKKKVDIKQLTSGYYDATLNEPLSDQMIKHEAVKLKQIERELIKLICKLKNGINDIKQIALNPNSLTVKRYFSIIIEEAMQKQNSNGFDKVAILRSLQQQTELIEQIENETSTFTIFAQSKSINTFVSNQEEKENKRIKQQSEINKIQQEQETKRSSEKPDELKEDKRYEGWLWWKKEIIEIVYNWSYDDMLKEMCGHVLKHPGVEHKDLLETDIVLQCCELLDQSIRSEKTYKVAEAADKHKTQWSILRSEYDDEDYKIYLIFDTGGDIQKKSDLCSVPKTCGLIDEMDIMVHQTLHNKISSDFLYIWKELNSSTLSSVTEVNIVGHSTGGGLAVLFGFEMIQRDKLKTNDSNEEKSEDRTYNIVTFGATPVFACKQNFREIATKIQNDKKMKLLHDMCHCFVNRLDLVPRWIHLIATIPKKMRDANKDVYNSKMVTNVANVAASKMYFVIGKQYIWCGKNETDKNIEEEMKIRTQHDIFITFEKEWDKVSSDIWSKMFEDGMISNYLIRLKNKYTLT